MKIKTPSFCVLLFVIFFTLSAKDSRSQQYEQELEMVSPIPGNIAIGKTIPISFRASAPVQDENNLILLDGDDITAMVNHVDNVFTYIPVTPLPPGEHSLYIMMVSEDGVPLEKELYFTTRHSDKFEEIYTNNRISATVKTALTRDITTSDEDPVGEDEQDFPYTTFDSYLSSESAIREGNWQSSFMANLRYYDQNAALEEPEKKWGSIIDFLATASYNDETYGANLEIGDTTIEESLNTVEYLTRRGTQASIRAGNFTLSGFGVLSQETGYEIDGVGLDFNSNSHIMGSSLKVDMLDQQMSLKAIYATGGEQEDSFDEWSETPEKKGDVAGLLFETDFFNQLLITDIELNTMHYDNDSGDEETKVNDKAYRIRISGLEEVYDYEAQYKYTGPQYDVVGNQSIIQDWAGFSLAGGRTDTLQTIRLLFDYSWDNVEDEDIYARIYSLTSGIDYTLNYLESLPINIIYEYNKQRSSDEPIDIETTSLDTNTITGIITYLQGPLNIEFSSSFSDQNDKSSQDLDTKLLTLGFVPSIVFEYFSIIPSWTLNSSEDLSTDVRTDTHTLTLDVMSSFYDDHILCEIGGTYDWSKSDDDNVDSNYSAAYARISYKADRLFYMEDSTLALEYTYNREEDNSMDFLETESIVSLVLSTAIPYTY